MEKTTIGLIRVVSFREREMAERHGKLIERHFPNLAVVSRCIQDQPKGIYDDETEAAAVPKITALGLELIQREKAAALIISCAADPGVRELREQVTVPVIGAGSAVAALALAYSRKVGVLGITEATPARMRELLGEYLVAEASPEGVGNTLDLLTERGRANALKAAESLSRRGARVIALACTGYSTLGIAPELQRQAGLPVLDAVLAAGLVAWRFTRDLQ